MENQKEFFMEQALNEAAKAKNKNEVPIGAVVVCDGKIISRAYNNREKKQNAINHAEVLAISKACKKLKSWRLDNCDIYVTLQPCLMCLGAIYNARIKNVYFGAFDTSNGKFNSAILGESNLNHKINFEGGILKDQCEKLLTDFFKSKR